MLDCTPSNPHAKCCPKCEIYKPLEDFPVDKRRRDGHYHHCKTCQREYYRTNINKFRQSQKKSRTRINNTPELLEKRREQKSRYARKQKKLFPEQQKIRRHTRRAEMACSSGKYTPKEWVALCEFCENRCLCCKEKKPLTVDHVKAISLGGSNSIDNIQPLCKSCNSRKGKKEIDYRTWNHIPRP